MKRWKSKLLLAWALTLCGLVAVNAGHCAIVAPFFMAAGVLAYQAGRLSREVYDDVKEAKNGE